MGRAYTLQQKGIETENMRTFQNAVSNYRLDLARDIIKNSGDFEAKELAMDIVSAARQGDIQTKNCLADMIEAWSINLNSDMWIDEVCSFCRQKPDIHSACSAMFLYKKHLFIIVDDMAQDSVLDYNLFAFELRGKYPEIKDFMVIDTEAFSRMKDELNLCSDIYKRG